MAATFQKSSVPDPLDMGRVEVLSSGSLCLDYALGVRGYPRGRICSIAGPQHAGKTALALMAIGTVQRHIEETERRRARIVIVDTEHAHSNSLAQVAGCDTSPDTMLVLRPLVAEEALMMVMYALGFETKDKGRTWYLVSDPADVVLFDSWAGTPTEGVGLAELPRIGAQWLPVIAAYTNRANALMFILNHIREDPSVTFGNPEYEPGGNAFQHSRSIGLLVHSSEKQKDDAKIVIGHDMRVDVRKNKLAPAFKRAFLRLNYITGFDYELDAVRFFEILGRPLKESPSGNIYTYRDIRGNGETQFVEALRDKPDTFLELLAEARSLLHV